MKNPDILAEVAALSDGPFTLGFAAETQKLVENARSKLTSKGIDMIAANLVGKGRGFDLEDNALKVLWSDGEADLPMQSKKNLARALISLAAEQYVRE